MVHYIIIMCVAHDAMMCTVSIFEVYTFIHRKMSYHLIFNALKYLNLSLLLTLVTVLPLTFLTTYFRFTGKCKLLWSCRNRINSLKAVWCTASFFVNIIYDILVGFVTPLLLRQCIALFAVAEGWLLLDIRWLVLFLHLLLLQVQ